MVTELVPSGISGRNRRLLSILHRCISGPFSADEAATALRLTKTRTHRLLSYLADRGWLLRLRRGLYSLVPLEVAKGGGLGGEPLGRGLKAVRAGVLHRRLVGL